MILVTLMEQRQHILLSFACVSRVKNEILLLDFGEDFKRRLKKESAKPLGKA